MLALDAVALGTGPAAPLPALTLTAPAGAVSVVAVETDERPLLVSLVAGGRLRPDAGAALLDGADDPAALRERVALVDTPVVAEPAPGVALRVAVAEDLALAGRPSGAAAVRAFLAAHGLADHARVPVRALAAHARIRLLCASALLRDGVDALVLTSPERHGGDPLDWAPALDAIAARGVAVLVVTDAPTARLLIAGGARDATAPLVPSPDLSTESPAA